MNAEGQSALEASAQAAEDVRVDVVAIATSAGGVSALRDLIPALPRDFAVPVLVVQHLEPKHPTMLPQILSAHASVPVQLAAHGEHLAPGVVYMCPPDYHLTVTDDGDVALTQTELVHHVRPSADLLFRSVADVYGARAVACVLTGTGQDGAAGASAVHAAGGTVIVQDPDSADFPGMPQAAIDSKAADHVIPLGAIVALLTSMIRAGSHD